MSSSSSQDQPRDPGSGSRAAAPPRDARDAQDARDTRDTRDVRDTRDTRDARGYVPRPAPQYDDDTGRRYEEAPSARTGAVMGFTMMAAVLMMLSGAWNFLEGLAAVLRGSPFPALPGYVYSLSVTGWGWFHLITGVVVFAVGAALITDNRLARGAGVVVAALSAIINFLFIPYLGFTAWWSLAVIALDIVIIWAL
ncbi:MAG TPA: hypothetical protein VI365_20345, partial [Trebonia sp.]